MTRRTTLFLAVQTCAVVACAELYVISRSYGMDWPSTWTALFLGSACSHVSILAVAAFIHRRYGLHLISNAVTVALFWSRDIDHRIAPRVIHWLSFFLLPLFCVYLAVALFSYVSSQDNKSQVECHSRRIRFSTRSSLLAMAYCAIWLALMKGAPIIPTESNGWFTLTLAGGVASVTLCAMACTLVSKLLAVSIPVYICIALLISELVSCQGSDVFADYSTYYRRLMQSHAVLIVMWLLIYRMGAGRLEPEKMSGTFLPSRQ